MTTDDKGHHNLHSSDENDPDQVRCDFNNANDEILMNGTCDSNSEPLCNVPPVEAGLSYGLVENETIKDEQALKSQPPKFTSRLKSDEASYTIKSETSSLHDDSEDLNLHEGKSCREKLSKSEEERNEEIINLQTVQGSNAISSSNEIENDETHCVETSGKYDRRADLPLKDCKNGMKSIEITSDTEHSPLISVNECTTEVDSLERNDCYDVFTVKNGAPGCAKQEGKFNEKSVGCDVLAVSCAENEGDGQAELSLELTPDQLWKIDKIKAVLKEPPLDIYALQQFAEEDDGFVTDELRQEVWPRLLLVHESKPPPLLTLQQAQLHPSYSQVVMDVERTLKRFPPDISPERRRTLMDELIRVIMTVLQRNPLFHYYQGYHDVGITFLLVCGELAAVQLLEELSLTHLREFLQPTMERTQRWLSYIYPMVASESPALYEHMDQSGVGTMFCLPWLITWYAHSLSQYRHVVRLYDFLLASPPLMPMYVAGVILLQREQQLLEVPCDMPMLHQALSSIPDNIPLDKIFREARLLYKSRPPSSLSDEVDLYLLRQKEREKAERAERDRRAAARKRGAGSPRPWWLPYSVLRSGGAWVRAAGAVAVVAVVLGLASLYFRPDGKLLLPVQWSAERPDVAPQ